MNKQIQELKVPAHLQDKFEEEIRVEIIRQQTEDELRTQAVYQEFFKQFNPHSVDSFIKNYARRKALYLTRGQDYLNLQEQKDLKYKMLAEEALWAIQQKKLFNLQCQWRAEQVKLKGVEHTTQFLTFGTNIQHCPFISPVSRAELELFVKFLKSGQANQVFGYENWQDYDAFKAESDECYFPGIDGPLESRMPAWYRFFDEHMGTGYFLTLPDYRGEKELKYRSAARKQQLQTIKNCESKKLKDNRPFLSIFDTTVVESFVKKFEDKRTLKYCKAVEEFQTQMDDNIELDDALETLRLAGIKVAVRANSDWKDAIIDAARQYELSQIADALTAVHQEYVFRLENGINFPQSIIDKKREEYTYTLSDLAKSQILLGRKILGEEQNMNF
ncbi:MAG: hypothetical protein ACKOX3_02780 [Bacteroidota bacterium]